MELNVTIHTGRRFVVSGFASEKDAERKARLFAKFGVPDVRDGCYTHWRPWQIKTMTLSEQGKDRA